MGLFSKRKTLEDQIFEMKFSVKQMESMAKKAQQREAAAKKKVKDAIEKSLMDQAAIHATTAIRAKNEALNMLRIASRVDAVVCQLQSFAAMNQVTSQMKGMTIALDQALTAMDMTAVQQVMEKFESQFEELGVRSAFAEETMASGTSVTAPQGEVDALISQVATEHGLEFEDALSAPGVAVAGPAVAAPAVTAGAPSLMDRFSSL